MSATPDGKIARHSAVRVPGYLRVLNPWLVRLMRAGVPSGRNVLLTVRGRTSGLPRSTPVAVIEVGGRRWIQGAYGEVGWVRNLRAAGEATLKSGSASESIKAAELNQSEAAEFFAKVFTQYVRNSPGYLRPILPALLGLRDAVGDPGVGARRHPVFEIHLAGD